MSTYTHPYLKMWRRLCRKGSFVVGGIIVIFIVLTAVFAPGLATHDPYKMNMAEHLQSPSAAHLFGTDEFGRDLFTRVVYGSRLTLRIGTISVGISLLVGGIVGITAGYFGGVWDLVVMRFIDIMLAFPTLLVAIVIVAIMGPSLDHAMIAVGLAAVPAFARLVRGSTLSVKETVYVEAARAVGGRHIRVMWRHIFPNIFSPLLVLVTLQFPAALLSAAGLSFVGLGAQPPQPEWGALLVSARDWLRVAPWLVNIPGLAILITVLGFNLLGNALRDVLDPTQRGV